jgi:hypothetical protein
MSRIIHPLCAALLLGGVLTVSCSRGERPQTKTKPARLQTLTVREGILQFADGSEVNLWGVNFQPNLSWEHALRMQPHGLFMPLRVEEMKQMTDESFAQLERLGCTVIRIHICPADFVDGQGRFVERIWLDLLDYTMAEARKRGIYVYLTLINEMKNGETQSPAFKDSFPHKYARVEWLVVPEAVEAARQYTRALLNRQNPYDQTRYQDNPAFALIEPVNEPEYVSREAMARHPRIQKVYQDWLRAEGRKDDAKAFGAFRYGTALAYLSGMVGVIRAEGAKQPLVWNCGWPRNIQHNEEIFQAIADSKMDAISYCLYPGQDDLKFPFWKYPEDLSARNYLPYLKQVSECEDWMGWIRAPRFASKAKLVYEFETMCNQRTYLFPAMAKLFRSTGVQVATLWTYTLSGYAPYCGGTHVFNLETTPRKAASFMIGGEVFRHLPRGVPFTTTGHDADAFQGFSLSHPLDLSVAMTDDSLIHSGPLPQGFAAAPREPRRIVGVGDSPFVSYAGTGLHFLERISDTQLHLTILPNARFLSAHWQRKTGRTPVVELDRATTFPFRLRLPGKRIIAKVERRVGQGWQAVTVANDQFPGSAGEYQVTLTGN